MNATKKSLHVWLRPGERMYVNGAVLCVDRKVSIEFLNDVTFLLEHHVMQAADATTPLRQLYFIIQTMLIEPASAANARQMFEQSHALLTATFENGKILAGLKTVAALMAANRIFEALKTVRSLFPIEDSILHPGKGAASQQVEENTWK